MAYVGHEWQDGELITAQKLNKLENAVASAATVENISEAVDNAISSNIISQIKAVSYEP